MRIDGKWALFDDGVVRPIASAEVLAADGSWVKLPFLVDTGADRTVFSAAAHAQLGLRPIESSDGISGLGGMTHSVIVETQIRLSRDNSGKVLFRGLYAAVTETETLDICVLGRDILELFAVIVDRPGGVVCMLGQRHRYAIEQV